MEWWRVSWGGGDVVVVGGAVVSLRGMENVDGVSVLGVAAVKDFRAARAADWVGQARREGETEEAEGTGDGGRGGRRGAVGGERRESHVWRSDWSLLGGS